MLYLYLIAALSLFAAATLWRLHRGFARPIRSWNELLGQTSPIDIAAFENLMSNDDEVFLRQSLPAREFRRLQRMRYRAAGAYVDVILRNSAVLIRAGELAAASDIDQVARAGARLVQLALEVRIRSLRLLADLWIAIILPTNIPNLADAVQRYAELKEAFRLLGALRDPVWAASISDAL